MKIFTLLHPVLYILYVYIGNIEIFSYIIYNRKAVYIVCINTEIGTGQGHYFGLCQTLYSLYKQTKSFLTR